MSGAPDRTTTLGGLAGAYLLGALPDDERARFEAHLDDVRRLPRGGRRAARRRRRAAGVRRRSWRRRRSSRRASWPMSSARPSCCAPPAAGRPAAARPRRGAAARRRRCVPAGGRARRRRSPCWSLGSRSASARRGCSATTARRSRRQVVRAGRAASAKVELEVRRRPGDAGRQRPARPAAAGRVYQVWLKRRAQAPRADARAVHGPRDGRRRAALPGRCDGVDAGAGDRRARRRLAAADARPDHVGARSAERPRLKAP